MLASTKLPLLRPLLPIAELDALVAAHPSWLDAPAEPPDGSETGATNAHRCPVDLIAMAVDADMAPEDATRLQGLGWQMSSRLWKIKGHPESVVTFQHPCSGALVISYPGYTGVRFCPGRVIFGRNDRIADITPRQLALAIQAHTAHLMPATTRAGAEQQFRAGGGKGRKRYRQFLLWTLRRIDLCVQARVGNIGRLLSVYQFAKSRRTRAVPILWDGLRPTGAPARGTESGLTWGVVPNKPEQDPVKQALADVIEENRPAVAKDRQRQGRMSLTLYDKGRFQQSALGRYSTHGAPLPVREFVRFEVTYRGLDACAGLLKLLDHCEPEEHYLLPGLIRRQKVRCHIGDGPIGHAVWTELDFARLHRAVQVEVLDLNRSRLRVTMSKGKRHLRPFTAAECQKITKTIAGAPSPLESDSVRRALMWRAMEDGNGINLFWALWPRRGQHPSPEVYVETMQTRKRDFEPGEAAAELRLIIGPRTSAAVPAASPVAVEQVEEVPMAKSTRALAARALKFTARHPRR